MYNRQPANTIPYASSCNCLRVNPNTFKSLRVSPHACRCTPNRHVNYNSESHKPKDSSRADSQIVKRAYGDGRFSIAVNRIQIRSCSFLLWLAMALSCFAILGVELWPGLSASQDGAVFAVMEMVDKSLSVITDDQPWRAQSNEDSSTCDYSIGQWVVKRRQLYNHMRWSIIRQEEDLDNRAYDGKSCKRWLSPMWACRLHPNRSNFAFESLIWKPQSCHLPPFNSNLFLHRMRNKTIAFIGDSLGRQQFQSLMCLITHGKDEIEDVLDVGIEYGFPIFTRLNKSHDANKVHQSNWAYRFVKTNTTIIFSWSTTLCHSEPMTKENTIPINKDVFFNQSKYINETISTEQKGIALHLDVPPTFLASNLKLFDVIILNSGPHWNPKKFAKNKWKIHIYGKLINAKLNAQVVNSYHNYTTHNLIAWLNAQLEQGVTKANIFYRSSSPHHFLDGEWDSGGHCDNTHYKFLNSIGKRRLNLLKTSTDPIGDSATKGTKVKLLNITWLSQLRDEAHISKYVLKGKNGSQDCLHWCMPGVPDTWNQILLAELLKIEFQTKNKSN